MIITRKQRESLKQVFDRGPIMSEDSRPMPITYRQFRDRVMGTYSMDGAVIVRWCGMWLVIETDGYTHS